jgi:hypothetical protein
MEGRDHREAYSLGRLSSPATIAWWSNAQEIRHLAADGSKTAFIATQPR